MTRKWTSTGPIRADDGSEGTITVTLVEGAPAPPLPTARISVSPPTVQAGHPATLTWSTNHATSVQVVTTLGMVVSEGLAGSLPLETNGAGTRTYTLTATGPGGTATATATLTVLPDDPPPPPPLPTATLSVVPAKIRAGQDATRIWRAEGADSVAMVNLTDRTVTPVSPAGSDTVSPTVTTTYALRATNAAGTVESDYATLTVTPAPPPPGPGLPLKFDFGTPSSPLAEGHTRVTPGDSWNEFRGWGWDAGNAIAPVDARDRGIYPPDHHHRWEGDDLTRDFCFANLLVFRCRVPPGTHAVKLTIGDLQGATVDCEIHLNGDLVDTYSSQMGYTLDRHYQVVCMGGELIIHLAGLGAAVCLCALEVGGEYRAPTPPSATRRFDFGTADSPVEPGHEKVTQFDYYNSQRAMGFEQNWAMVFSRDRGVGTNLARDFCFNRRFTFRVDVPPGRYRLKTTHCDVAAPHDWWVDVQGERRETVEVPQSQVVEREYLCDAPDGVIRLKLDGSQNGTGDDQAVLNALTVEPAGDVPPPPELTARLSVTPQTIRRGESATLAWETTGATAVSLFNMTNSTARPVAPVGSESVAATETTTWKLSASNSSGFVQSGLVTLTVEDAPPPPPEITASIKVTPAAIRAGESATMEWAATNADRAYLREEYPPGMLGPQASGRPVGLTGSEVVSPRETTVYTLLAYPEAALDPPVTASATLTVEPVLPPPGTDPPMIEVSHGGHAPAEYVPDYGHRPTLVAKRTGLASDPSTWEGGRPPRAGDVVAWENVEVRWDLASDSAMDVVSPRRGATLTLAPDSRLVCGTLLPMDGSAVWAALTGTDTAEVVFADGPFPAWDPGQYGGGLVCLGRIDLRGSDRGKTWGWSGEPLVQGYQTINFLDGAALKWRVGDLLLIPDTRRLSDPSEPADRDEYATVAAVSDNGGSVILAEALKHAHPGSADLPYGVPVANLSRDIVFRSASPSQANRGHAMFTGHAKARLAGVEFRDLGRSRIEPFSDTNIKGRYSLHVHHCHTHDELPPATVEGCCVRDTDPRHNRRWGITVHGTNGCVVRNNAVHNVSGWGIGTEDGSEAGNDFDGNWVGGVTGYGIGQASPDSRSWREAGFSGDGFWLRGLGNKVRNNVSVNCVVGYGIYCSALPEQMLIGGVMRSPYTVPIPDFSNNVALGGRMVYGLTLWDVGNYSIEPLPDAPEQALRVAAWNVIHSAYINYRTNRVKLANFQARNCHVGFYGTHYMLGSFTMEGGSIKWCDEGILTGNQTGRPASPQIYRNVHLAKNGTHVRVNVKDDAPDEPRRNACDIYLHNLTYEGGGPRIVMDGGLVGIDIDLTCPVRVWVTDHDGVPGDDFRVYFNEQRADYVMPPADKHLGGPIAVGNPRPGWTNAQLRDAGLPVFAGEVAPADAATRPGVVGLVK